MTNEEWSEWVCYHATLFQMSRDEDVALFAAWKPRLLAFELQEIKDASMWIAENHPRTFRTEHLGSLKRQIWNQRAARSASTSWQDAENLPKCKHCDGIGLISVPHISKVIDGVWDEKTTMVVGCICRRGMDWVNSTNKYLEEKKKKYGAWGIIQYENKNSNWPEQLVAKENGWKDEAVAEYLANKADAAGGFTRLISSIGKG